MSLLNKIAPFIKLCKKNENIKKICKRNKENLAKTILSSADYNKSKIENKSYSKVLLSVISAEQNGITPHFLKTRSKDYIVKRILGCGSSGCVYWAEDKYKRSVIIKSGQDLANEKRILKILNKKSRSPIFPTYIGSFIENSISYLVTTPFLDLNGEPAHDLFNFLQNGPGLSEKESKKLYLNILKAIREMNKLGIKHKDLKPQNILVNTNLDIQIIDFGVACYSSDSRCTYGFTRRYQPDGYTGKNLEYGSISDLYSVIQILGDITRSARSAQRPIKIEGDSFYEKLENLKRDGIILSRLYTLLKEYCTEQNCMNFINIDELINLV